MKLFVFLMMFISLNAFACWHIEGSLGVDGETWKIDQKFEHDKDYSFPMGTFILNMSFKKGKGKTHKVLYSLHEKKGTVLNLVTKGEDSVTEKATKEIYAKGEENQPNTIIILKLK